MSAGWPDPLQPSVPSGARPGVGGRNGVHRELTPAVHEYLTIHRMYRAATTRYDCSPSVRGLEMMKKVQTLGADALALLTPVEAGQARQAVVDEVERN